MHEKSHTEREQIKGNDQVNHVLNDNSTQWASMFSEGTYNA